MFDSKVVNTFNILGIKCIRDGADVILIVFEIHAVGEVGIALKSPGSITGAELVTLPLFPEVEQLVFVGRNFVVPRRVFDILLGIEFTTL